MIACDMAAGIRAKRFTCVDVMEAVVARIAAKNPELNAIVYDYSDQARAQAERAHRAVTEGAPLGPLHGVPVTIKENVDVKGTPTPNGMAALEHIIAPDHAPVVQNLLNAGAIIVGRTNTPELSMRATTDNPLHGRTLNPWDHDASPGGSSGGGSSAAARCASPPSPAASPRSSPPIAGCRPGIPRRPPSAACWRSSCRCRAPCAARSATCAWRCGP
jgi:amidase